MCVILLGSYSVCYSIGILQCVLFYWDLTVCVILLGSYSVYYSSQNLRPTSVGVVLTSVHSFILDPLCTVYRGKKGNHTTNL